MIALLKNTATTPARPGEIAASVGPATVLAKRFTITEHTACKWKNRQALTDGPLKAHRLLTILIPAQKSWSCTCRTLQLLHDDLLAIPRAGVDRCLRRSGVGNLNALRPITLPGALHGLQALWACSPHR